MAIQIVARAICEGIRNGKEERAIIISTQAAGTVARSLRDSAARQIGELGIGINPVEVLSTVQIVQVFDLRGVWEVVIDLQPDCSPASPSQHRKSGELRPAPGARGSGSIQQTKGIFSEAEPSPLPKRAPRDEIPDSEDEDSPFSSPEAEGPAPNPDSDPNDAQKPIPQTEADSRTTPNIILITHFSTLLTTLFTHSEKAAAHNSLQRLSSHLRNLTRQIESDPLVLITNTTASGSSTEASHNPNLAPTRRHEDSAYSSSPRRLPSRVLHSSNKPLDPTLLSVFNRASPAPHGSGSAAVSRKHKPSFGLVFTQFLDLHLLCTTLASTRADAESEAMGKRGRRSWVVEVLLDEIGVWEGKTGRRKGREERWGAVDVREGRIVDARVALG